MFATLGAYATRFATHLAKNHATDPRAQNLLRTWNGTVQVSTRNTGATFYTRNGCMVMNPYYETKLEASGRKKNMRALPRTPGSQPGMDDFGRLLTRMLHELAHSTGLGHDAAFYDAQRFFLRVASGEMGWPLKTTCRVCCHSAEPCESACPKCIWIEENSPQSCSQDDSKCSIE